MTERFLRYVTRARALGRHIARAEQLLKDLKRRQSYYLENLIPSEAEDLDWDEGTMAFGKDGKDLTIKTVEGTVVIQDTFHPHIVKRDQAKRAEQFKWIEAHGGRDSVTLALTLTFRRGEGKKARAVLNAIGKADPSVVVEKTKDIHYQTLQALCRKWAEKGIALPDLLGVFQRQTATLIEPFTITQPPAVPDHEFRPIPAVAQHQLYED